MSHPGLAVVDVPSPPISPPLPPVTNLKFDIPNIAGGIINWIFWGLIILAVIMFLVGGYGYATSGGDPEKTSVAGKRLQYAAIAVVIAIVAAGLPQIVASFFGTYIPPVWPF